MSIANLIHTSVAEHGKGSSTPASFVRERLTPISTPRTLSAKPRSHHFTECSLGTSLPRTISSNTSSPLLFTPGLSQREAQSSFGTREDGRNLALNSSVVRNEKFLSGVPTTRASRKPRNAPFAQVAVPPHEGTAEGRVTRRARNRPFTCARCPATFQSRGHKANHEATVHDGKRPHKCAHCPARFGLKWNLATHVRRVHELQRPFACDHCDMAFAQRYDLKRHCGLMHGTQAGLYKCACGGKFNTRRMLAVHSVKAHREQATDTEHSIVYVRPPLRCA